ncbi:hypothetical protein ABW20_dc0105289 [Dactylellina cionopaga]|nr:hypothetical protein ABW20_dc0105289 [Dactylellina cionopaga]
MPVFTEISSGGDSLTDRVAGVRQIQDSVILCAEDAGVLARVINHDVARKSGTINTEASKMLGHRTLSHYQSLTDDYVGNLCIDICKKRMIDTSLITAENRDSSNMIPELLARAAQGGLTIQEGAFDGLRNSIPREKSDKYVEDLQDELFQYKNEFQRKRAARKAARGADRTDRIKKGERGEEIVQAKKQANSGSGRTYVKTKEIDDFLAANPNWKPRANLQGRRKLASIEIRRARAENPPPVDLLTNNLVSKSTEKDRLPIQDVSNMVVEEVVVPTKRPKSTSGIRPSKKARPDEEFIDDSDFDTEDEDSFMNPEAFNKSLQMEREVTSRQAPIDKYLEDFQDWDLSNEFMVSLTCDSNIGPALLALTDGLPLADDE